MAEGNIFISYRRGADSNAAGRLYDRLERKFSSGQLFFDIDSIPLGVDFAEHIDGEVAKCHVQLVVIGPGWLEETGRLQDPDDYVRIEIEAALRRPDIPVIPVLFEGAKMPGRDVLPEVLHPLMRRNAILLNHAQFTQIVDGRLSDALCAVLSPGSTSDEASQRDDPVATTAGTDGQASTVLPVQNSRNRKWSYAAGALIVLAALAGAASLWIEPDFKLKFEMPDSARTDTEPAASFPIGADDDPPWVALAVNDAGDWGASIALDGLHVAVADAVRRCSPNGCRVVMSGQGRCVAVATSKVGGVWFGHAYGNDPIVVREIALRGCTDRAPGGCLLQHADCVQ